MSDELTIPPVPARPSVGRMHVMPEPWAYIAHKDGKWGGVAYAKIGVGLPAWIGSYAMDGFSITTVFSREEYKAVTENMEMWEPPMEEPAPTTEDLFAEQKGVPSEGAA